MNLIILRELSLTNTFRQGDNLDFFYQLTNPKSLNLRPANRALLLQGRPRLAVGERALNA